MITIAAHDFNTLPHAQWEQWETLLEIVVCEGWLLAVKQDVTDEERGHWTFDGWNYK